MNVFKDIIEALLEGKTIVGQNGNQFKLDKEGKLIGAKTGHPANLSNFNFLAANWELKQWYDDIPEVGVLCWVGLTTQLQNHTVEIIIDYKKEEDGCFKSATSSWRFATPLASNEVQLLLDVSKTI